MIKINKEIFKKAFLAGIFSAFTIGVLTVLTYKSALGLFIAGSYGSSMVLVKDPCISLDFGELWCYW